MQAAERVRNLEGLMDNERREIKRAENQSIVIRERRVDRTFFDVAEASIAYHKRVLDAYQRLLDRELAEANPTAR